MTLEEIVDEAVFAQATKWWSVQRDSQLSERDSAALMSWLRESPQHVEAYLAVATAADGLARACRAWTESEASLIDKAAAEHGAEVIDFSRPQVQKQPRPGRNVGWRMSLVAASLAVISLSVVWLLRDQLFNWPQTFRTAHAEQGSWRLADGSVLQLNSDSSVVVRLSKHERLVVVERGQAMFQVAKDPRRRFRVDAQDAQVVAIGTEFDVDRHSGSTAVTVLEGEVAVIAGTSAPPLGPPTLSIANAIAVRAGEQLDVGMRDAVPKPVNIARVRAWTQRQIVFDGMPLGAVIDEFNRYSAVPIEIADEPLKSIPVSGVFSAYDIDSFMTFLGNLDGIDIQRSPNRIRILMRPVQGLTPRLPQGEKPIATSAPRAA